ncbi:alpha type subunit of oroteasome [Mitosporidium daphniae]|uniref:Proteasome subunit alpha type n=1 Tax=Mitosporidium daphniae TaxID=1485682 RepID=A0A098VUL2_9MICR|nr:alpha type subunit of oroteasome [Mitosporidium daphniae]KGG51356.1 alpha type subunit of oroteasome [Mitosporidium daphniae]|eukprot:XP_013237783.1 alpha type subunit of oroteasome [Mitosporidium daphniae]
MSRKYDSRTTTFSPEGRLYQVEYAMEAISHAGLTLGIMASDGIALVAVRRKISGTLEEPHQVGHLVAAVAGLTADANILVKEARSKSLEYWRSFSSNIPIELLVQRIGNLKQGFTQMGGLRPFGVSLLYAGYDKSLGFQLYHSDPSGNYSAWKATAVGAQSQAAQSFLKNEFSEGLSLVEVKDLAFRTLRHVLIGDEEEANNEEDDIKAGDPTNADTMDELDLSDIVATGMFWF